MNREEIHDLNDRFAIADQLRFLSGEAGLTFLEVISSQATALIALQGAQLLHWEPVGEDPVIWLSPEARYTRGASIRGGVPICWPWFGPHPSQSSYPAHGFARTLPWEVTETRLLDDGRIGIRLQLPTHAMRDDLWPHACRVTLSITLGEHLEMELLTLNTGAHEFPLSEALHTYFRISDIGAVQVTGLEACEYLDKVNAMERRRQQGVIDFHGETDRIYMHTTAECCIQDPGLGRTIRIRKQGSQSTVVWNPWSEKAERMGDLGADGYRHMLCVESANAADNVIQLAPGDEHRLWVSYEVLTAGK